MHARTKIRFRFDDPNLIGYAGLVPIMALAARCGLDRLTCRLLTVPGSARANAWLKVPAIVAGMAAGADSIDDLDRLRHGAMGRVFGGIRTPSTLGTFLRAFTWGHVRQLEQVARTVTAALPGHAPVLSGAATYTLVDADSTIRQVFGYAKQGASYGYTKVKGPHPLLAVASTPTPTPTPAPLVVACRPREGRAGAARGAASFVAEALGTARAAGATGLVPFRADSAFYSATVVAACRRAGARFSITVRIDAAVRRAIATIPDTTWTAIRYPRAVWDDDEQRFISDARIAEVHYTAFTSHREAEQVTGRLLVRRVRRLNPASVPHGQGELFTVYRYHAAFTDSDLEPVQADATQRAHAIVEQVIAGLKASALAHLPSGRFAANAAWLVLACLAFNLTRAAGVLASRIHAKATTATIRDELIHIAEWAHYRYQVREYLHRRR
ncbi:MULTISPECIES: IS1380 family transposase [unclassified Frankia]|uniref:IS1380 family transposase n=1 Tax=unclassified Frankia TaxID=2632575 RepID=UPI002AD32F50|nr:MULTISPECIES: IS1380 family transposase [unclassified Frankia]